MIFFFAHAQETGDAPAQSRADGVLAQSDTSENGVSDSKKENTPFRPDSTGVHCIPEKKNG